MKHKRTKTKCNRGGDTIYRPQMCIAIPLCTTFEKTITQNLNNSNKSTEPGLGLDQLMKRSCIITLLLYVVCSFERLNELSCLHPYPK